MTDWIVMVTKDAPGRVTLSVYERGEFHRPGQIVRVELDDFEMERLHLVCGEALWDKVRGKERK